MSENRLTVEEAAEIMGASPQFVRIGLRQGIFPWGYAVKISRRWTYYINRGKFLSEEKMDGKEKDEKEGL